MKKILILAYDYPPYVSIGALRPFYWYKHFKKYDLYPIIITRQWGENNTDLNHTNPNFSKKTIYTKSEFGLTIKTPYSPDFVDKLRFKFGDKNFLFFRKLITLIKVIFQFVFVIGNQKNIYIEARKYLKQNNVDFILATGEPFVLFHYANKLSKEYNVPWGGDYRDPWILNRYFVNPLLRILLGYIEKKLLKKINLITTVSEFMSKGIEANLKTNVPIKIIPNGFDNEIRSELKEIKQNDKILTIAYAGTIYPYHPVESFFDVLEHCKQNDKTFHFNLIFYGINKQEQISLLIEEKYPNLKQNINFVPKLSYQNLLKKISEANALLLFNEYSFLGTKIYDYLAVNRLIIHCFKNDPKSILIRKKHFPVIENQNTSSELQENLIKFTKAGVSISDQKEMKRFLIDLNKKFSKNKRININSKNVELFSRKSQSKNLANEIKSIINLKK